MRLIRRDLETDPAIAVTALVAGAGAGGLIPLGVFLLGTVATGTGIGVTEIGLALLFGFATALVYLVGLAVFGVPVWIVAHRLGLRDWWCAMLAGALLNGGLIAVFTSASQTGQIAASLLFAGAGAAIGWIVWRVAYRKVRAPDAEVF